MVLVSVINTGPGLGQAHLRIAQPVADGDKVAAFEHFCTYHLVLLKAAFQLIAVGHRPAFLIDIGLEGAAVTDGELVFKLFTHLHDGKGDLVTGHHRVSGEVAALDAGVQVTLNHQLVIGGTQADGIDAHQEFPLAYGGHFDAFELQIIQPASGKLHLPHLRRWVEGRGRFPVIVQY